MTPTTDDQRERRRGLLGPRLAALFVLGLGGLTLTQVSQIGPGAGFIVVGPRVFPIIVGIGLLVLGGAFVLRTTALPDKVLATEVADEEAATHWPTTLSVLLVLVVYALLLGPLGYTVATALFFPAVARLIGSVHWRRDLIVGLVLGLAIYLTFTRILGVRLPAGILAGIL